MRPQLLLIEDDAALRRSLVLTLADEGFEVREAADGRQGLRGLEQTPDAVLLDLGLPDVDGFELCRRLRQRTANPILIISARQAPDDITRGLASGADDFLVKPFLAVELARRLRGLLGAAATHKSTGHVEPDPDPRRGSRAGDGLDLTVTEARMLAELAARPGAVVSRDALLRRVWGETPAAGAAVLVARVSSLCSKLEGAGRASIETTGAGYRLPG
jgi:DNA-binding response OmpR family regulator